MTSPPDPLPEGSLLLHIGPPKTGSTAIQTAMHQRRAELARHGVLYPGRLPDARESFRAVMGLPPLPGRPGGIAPWQQLVEEIESAGTGGTARICLSSEVISRADADAVGRILDALGAERTHVVYVARRQDRVLPSQWQERLKTGLAVSFEDYLRRVLDREPGDRLARSTRAPQEAGDVLGRWGRHLPGDRIVVIVSDERDHSLLPRTFERLLALPEGFLASGRHGSNRSLAYTEAEATRRLNEIAVAERWDMAEHRRIIRNGVIPQLVRRPPADGPRITGLPHWALAKAADLADRQIEAIQTSGATVLGDPESLRIRGRVEPAELPGEVTAVPMDLFGDIARGLVAGGHLLREDDRSATAVHTGPHTGPEDPHLSEAGGRALAGALLGRIRHRIGL